MHTLATIAREIMGRYGTPYPEALTTVTAYAIQLDVDCGVQEGDQSPNTEVDDKTRDHIHAAFAATPTAQDATLDILRQAEEFARTHGNSQLANRLYGLGCALGSST